MAIKGYLAVIKEQSSAISFSNEVTTTTDDKTYIITNASKRIWNYNSVIVVKDSGVVTTEKYTISRLTGSVVFETAVSRVITITGDYVLLTDVVQGKSFSLKASSDALDSTVFNSIGFKTFEAGNITGTVDIGKWLVVDSIFIDMILNGEIKVIEYYPNAGLDPIRMFGLMTTESANANVDGLIEESLSFQITREITQ